MSPCLRNHTVLVTVASLAVLLLLSAASMAVGAADLQLDGVLRLDPEAVRLLLASRLPRTLALILAGTGLAMAGLLMQMLVRNRFVEPSTVGTTESAGLGMLLMMLLAPGAPVLVKMVVAAVCALAGTFLFLRIVAAVPLRSVLMVPLIGILLSGVIGSATTFLAYRYDLLQALGAWTTGDFSVVLRGRYELLWIAAASALAAYLAADRFTVAGLGKDFATNLGLNYRRVVALGVTLVALVSAAVIVTVGSVPFLGLVVPNVVSLLAGDNMRRTLPFTALLGAGLVLACDVAGRLVIRPYEIPIGAMMGVIGSFFFLFLLLRSKARVA